MYRSLPYLWQRASEKLGELQGEGRVVELFGAGTSIDNESLLNGAPGSDHRQHPAFKQMPRNREFGYLF